MKWCLYNLRVKRWQSLIFTKFSILNHNYPKRKTKSKTKPKIKTTKAASLRASRSKLCWMCLKLVEFAWLWLSLANYRICYWMCLKLFGKSGEGPNQSSLWWLVSFCFLSQNRNWILIDWILERFRMQAAPIFTVSRSSARVGAAPPKIWRQTLY